MSKKTTIGRAVVIATRLGQGALLAFAALFTVGIFAGGGVNLFTALFMLLVVLVMLVGAGVAELVLVRPIQRRVSGGGSDA